MVITAPDAAGFHEPMSRSGRPFTVSAAPLATGSGEALNSPIRVEYFTSTWSAPLTEPASWVLLDALPKGPPS